MSKDRRPEVGLDFFTVTTSNLATSETLLHIAETERDKAQEQAVFPKAFSNHGYSGWRVPRCSYAKNSAEKVLFTLFGGAAQDWALALFKLVDLNVNRLDLAVTIQLERPRNLAKLGYAEKLGPRSTGTLLNTKRTIFLNDDGGATLYLGKRGGERFARLYDKGVQSKTHAQGELWRFEVEFRRAVATSVFMGMRKQANPFASVPALVWDHFSKRGVTPPFERGISTIILERHIESQSLDTKLTWLTRSVAPVVQQLLLAGFRDEVYNSLGLYTVSDRPLEVGKNGS